MASFGEGLGTVIGANMADNHLDNALSSVNDTASNFRGSVAGYNDFGLSFLNPATSAIEEVQDAAHGTQGYNQFMSTYENTPAAKYQIQQGEAAQENSAAAHGGLLSGSNQRALAGIRTGIVSQNANTAYNEYLAGNNQQFGQLESALGNMFSAIGVGQTATGQRAAVDVANMGAQTKIAESQAKNDKDKGSGIGSMFGGLGSAAFAF